MSWSEHQLHGWLASLEKPKSIKGSANHDAAVLSPCASRRAVCVDQTIESVHFASDASPAKIALKAVGRALSDLAATAASPRQVLLSLSAPTSKSNRWMRALITGVRQRAAHFGAELVAGDLACAPGPVHVSITALGALDGQRKAPGRDRARAGQLVLLTGPTGGSIRGRHLHIEPRVQEGLWLYRHGATAMMDVSDGLALDLSRICSQSQVGIDLERVRVHRDARWLEKRDGRLAIQHALTDGEDHELIATMNPSDWKRAKPRAARKFPLIEVVGVVRKTGGLRVISENGEWSSWTGRGGWLHG